LGTSLLQNTYTYDDGDETPPPSGPPPTTPPTEKILYSAYFRVSQYNTFLEKIAAFENSMMRIPNGPGHGQGGGTPEEAPDNFVLLDFSIPTNIEPFDFFELSGNNLLGGPLMEIKFDPGGINWGGTWYMGMVRRIMYPYEGSVPALGYGTPAPFPLNTVSLISTPSLSLKITKQHFTNGLPASFNNVTQKIRHFTPKVIYDYYVSEVSKRANEYLAANQNSILTAYADICSGTNDPCQCLRDVYAANDFNGTYNFWLSDLLCHLKNDVPTPPYTYPIRVSYRLPGIDQKTYDNIVKLKPE
jgi:hypothetical protein